MGGRIAVDCEILLKAGFYRHESMEVIQGDIVHIRKRTIDCCHAVCASA